MVTATQSCLGPITKFIAWHSRLAEMDDHFANTSSNEEWQRNCQAVRVRHLRIALDEIALANGATHLVVGDDGGLRLEEPNPTFDWQHGQIDYAPVEDRWEPAETRGDALIAELVEVTGIPE